MDSVRLMTAGLPRLALPSAALPGQASGAIPRAIREALVCWYSPRRQGCTNESMAAEPILRDLSGNGLDLTCHNFAWTAQSGIGEDGAMAFDGIDDICDVFSDDLKERLATDFTVIIRSRNDRQSSRSTLISSAEFPNAGAFIIDLDEDFAESFLYYNFGNSQIRVSKVIGVYTTKWVTPTSYNEIPTTKGTAESTRMLALGGIRLNDSRVLGGAISSCLIFDRTLTGTEIEWVKLNMID